MLRVLLEEAKEHLPDLITAALQGETVVIQKAPEEAVQLVPAVSSGQRQFGSAKGLSRLSEDFDAPLPDFDEYLP